MILNIVCRAANDLYDEPELIGNFHCVRSRQSGNLSFPFVNDPHSYLSDLDKRRRQVR